MSAAEGPALRHEPALAGGVVRGKQGQDVADGIVQAAVEGAHDALPLRCLGEDVALGRDAERQLLLDQHEVGRILVGGDGAVGGEAERAGKLAGESARHRPIVAPRASSAAIRLGSCQSGTPSVRQWMP